MWRDGGNVQGYCSVIGVIVWSKFVGVTLYVVNLKNGNRSKWSESRVIDVEMMDGMQFGGIGRVQGMIRKWVTEHKLGDQTLEGDGKSSN